MAEPPQYMGRLIATVYAKCSIIIERSTISPISSDTCKTRRFLKAKLTN